MEIAFKWSLSEVISVDIPAICCQVLASTPDLRLIEADLNILLFNVPGQPVLNPYFLFLGPKGLTRVVSNLCLSGNIFVPVF